jgi:hypothetical protein
VSNDNPYSESLFRTAKYRPDYPRRLEKLRAQDQREIKDLKKELQRKEKAMAEMAALLVLRKKWEAFCSEDAEG